MKIKPNKNLGQNFLSDVTIAENMINTLKDNEVKELLEVGPGLGFLTRFLFANKQIFFD